MPHTITGLDIGSHQIKGMVVEEKRDGTLSLLTAFKYPSAGIRRGVLVDVEEAAGVLRALVLDLQRISKHITQNVYVNMQSSEVRSRPSRGIVPVSRADQEIQRDDIDRAVQASQAVKLSPNYLALHNIIREYIVDDVGDIADPLGMTGNRLEVSTLVVEAFAPQVNILLKNLERVGLRVGGVIFNPLAAARAALSKQQRDLGVLLLDFGFGTTSLAVYEENKVMYTKCIPLGAGYITNDIAIGLKTSIDAAEKLKVNYGCAVAKEINRREMVKLSEVDPANLPAQAGKNEIPRRFLAELIEIRLVEILGLVNNELKTLGRSAQLPAGVVATGGGVKLAGTTDLIREELKLPAQIGFPNLSGFEISNPAHQDLVDDPEFAVATGLVLWGGAESKKPLGGRAAALAAFFRNLMP